MLVTYLPTLVLPLATTLKLKASMPYMDDYCPKLRGKKAWEEQAKGT